MKWLDKYSEDVPKAQSGKDISPTRADSLAIYNQNRKVENYYKKYEKDPERRISKYDGVHQFNDLVKEDFLKQKFVEVAATNNKSISVKPRKEHIRQDVNNNKYYQRESTSAILDTRAPYQLFDRRIMPTHNTSYLNTTKGDSFRGDIVDIYTYDPIAIKPFDLLTEKEKAERVKKYGTDGVPKSYLNKIAKTPLSTTPKKQPHPITQPLLPQKPTSRVEETLLINPIKIEDEQYTPINSTREVNPVVRSPKKYKVETSGGGKFGGWLNTYELSNPENFSAEKGSKQTITPIYQSGGNIPSSGSIDYDYVNYGTPEYEEAYKQGKFAHATNQLDEVVVTPYDKQYPYYQSLSTQQKKFINDDSPIGRQIRGIATDGVGFNAEKAEKFAMGWLRDLPLSSLQAPQSALVEGIEALRGKDYNFLNALEPDKQRIPSETWGIKNPYAAFAVDTITDPELLTGVGMATSLPRFGKKLGQEIVETNVPTLKDLKINHKLLDFNDLPEIMEKYRDPFIRKYGPEFEEKDLGLFAKLNEIGEKRIMSQYEDPDIMKLIVDKKPDKLFSMEPRRVAKALTDNFTKIHDIPNTYSPRERLLADIYSNGYDNLLNGRQGAENYMKDLYDPLREEFQQLILKNKTKRPEVFFRESDDFIVEDVWDASGNKIAPMNFNDLQKGYTYSPKGFTSTTLAPSQVGFGNILSRINVPEQQPILNINSTGGRNFYNELENVLPNNIKFKIDDVIEDPLEYGKGYSKVFNKSIINPLKNGGVIKDNRGQWAHPGEITEIDSPEITMQGVSYPVLGVSKQTGEKKMMFPEKNYKFANTKQVVEYPMGGKNWLDKFN